MAMFTVDLGNIPEDGEEFELTRGSEELQGLFDDLISETASLNVHLKIQPQGNFFSVTGSMKSSYEDTCSRCGYPVELPLEGKVNEMLIFDGERPRKYQSNHHHETSAGGLEDLSVTYLESLTFDVGGFLNEVMVMCREDYPRCANKKQCDSQIHKLTPAPEPSDPESHPFSAALKGLKLTH